MIAGLPGTGIGGLFYLLLAFWMPGRELWLTLRGRSGPARWREVAGQAALAAAIVAVLTAEGWALQWLADLAGLPARLGQGAAAGANAAAVLEAVAPTLALLPLAVLALLWLGVHALRLALRRAPSPARPDLPPVPLAPPAERRRVRGGAQPGAAGSSGTQTGRSRPGAARTLTLTP